MSTITHQKARSLLQAAADNLLKSEDKSALDIHLATCKPCQEYASNLTVLENNLREAFHLKWDNQHPADVSLQAIIKPTLGKLLWSNSLGQTGMMGKATIVVTLLLGYLVIANLFGNQSVITGEKTATLLPTPNESKSIYSFSPTPSAPVTLTNLTTQVCNTYPYTVQENDTLTSIAFQHGTTQAAILKYNHLSSNTVFTGMELVIPLCNNTPSHTATITPINGTIFPAQSQ